MKEVSAYQEKKVLVTGATGFLGSYILRYLKAYGFENLSALKRPESKLDLVEDIKDINWIDCDVREQPYLYDIIAEQDWVIHAAGVVSFQKKDRPEMFHTNVEGTYNVVNAGLDTGLEKLIHVSSIAAVGRPQHGNRVNEKNNWTRSPHNTAYGLSKYQGEREVWRGIAEGLNGVIVNPAIILGSGYWNGGTQRLFKMAYDAFPFYGTGIGNFVDVRDVAQFIVELGIRDILKERFILCAENLPYKALITKMAKEFGTKPPYLKANAQIRALSWRLAAIQRFFTGKATTITRESANQSAKKFYFDNEKSKALFGFDYLPLSKTIKETCVQYTKSIDQKKSYDILPLTKVPSFTSKPV